MGCFPWRRQRARSGPPIGSGSVKVRGILKTPCEASPTHWRGKKHTCKSGGAVSFKDDGADGADLSKGDAIDPTITDTVLDPDNPQPDQLPETPSRHVTLIVNPLSPILQPPPSSPPQQPQPQPPPPSPPAASPPSSLWGSTGALTAPSQPAISTAAATNITSGTSPPGAAAGRLAELRQLYRQRSKLEKGPGSAFTPSAPTLQPVQVIGNDERLSYDSFTAAAVAIHKSDTVRSATHQGGFAVTSSAAAATVEYDAAQQTPSRRPPTQQSQHSAPSAAASNDGYTATSITMGVISSASGACGGGGSNAVQGASWVSGQMAQSKRLLVFGGPPAPPIIVPQHRLDSLTAIPGSLPSVTRRPGAGPGLGPGAPLRGGAARHGGLGGATQRSTHGPAGYSSSTAIPLGPMPPQGLVTSEMLPGGKSNPVLSCGQDRALVGDLFGSNNLGARQAALSGGIGAAGGRMWVRPQPQQQQDPVGDRHGSLYPGGGTGGVYKGGGTVVPTAASPGNDQHTKETPPASVRPTTAVSSQQLLPAKPSESEKALGDWARGRPPVYPSHGALGISAVRPVGAREPQCRALNDVAVVAVNGGAAGGEQQRGDTYQLLVQTAAVQRIEAAKANEAMLSSLMSGGRCGVDVTSKFGAGNNTVDELLRFDRVSDAMTRLEGIMATAGRPM